MLPDIVVLDSRDQPPATCITCGNPVEGGGGVTASFHSRVLRFRLRRLPISVAIDPDHYLTDGSSRCCDGDHDEPEDPVARSSPSEWTQ